MKVLTLYNTKAGRHDGHLHASWLKKAIKRKSPESQVTLYASESIDAMLNFFKGIEPGFDCIAIIGGDGTVGPTIDAMIKSDLDLPIYCYGRGTANDFASFLGTNRSPKKAARIILRNQPSQVDTILVNGTTYACNVACGGAFTNGVTRYNKKAKRLLGKLAYIIQAAFIALKLESQTLRFTVDDNTFDADVYIFYILNSKNVGGLKGACPVSSISDGNLDLVCIKKCGFFARISIALSQLSGTLDLNSNVVHMQGKSFRVEHIDDNIKPNFTHTDIDGNGADPYPLEVTVGTKIKVFHK